MIISSRLARGRPDITTKIGNHTFRATGVTAYLKNGGALERAVLTLAARNEDELSDADVLGMLLDLEELRIVETDDSSIGSRGTLPAR